MSAPFSIRAATAEDRELLAKLYRECLERADWFPKAALAQIDFERDTLEELVLFAADEEGKPLGFIGVWEPESFIHHLYVAEAQRGRGVGRALLAALVGKVPYPWRLKCVVANHAAHGFYTSLGWYEVERAHGDRGEYALLQLDGA